MHRESSITERGKLRNVPHHTELWVVENRRRMEGGAVSVSRCDTSRYGLGRSKGSTGVLTERNSCCEF